MPVTFPEFPKPLVRLLRLAGAWHAEVRVVASAEDESAATAAGWAAIDVPTPPPDFVEWPKWLYHADGQRRIVQTPAEAETLEGFEETPQDPEPAELPAA